MGGIVNSALGSLPMINRAQGLVGDYQSEQRAAAQTQHAKNVLAQSQTLERIQLAQDQDAGLKARQADVDQRKAELTAAAAVGEQDRRDTLARKLARTRAGLGARGVGSGDGSAGALLAGLVSDADGEDQQSRTDLRQQNQALDLDVENTRRRNLLELSQLADRQKLESYSKSY
jgi:colicin import membrane protein